MADNINNEDNNFPSPQSLSQQENSNLQFPEVEQQPEEDVYRIVKLYLFIV